MGVSHVQALVSNLDFISQLLFKKFPSNIIVQIIGTWSESEAGSGMSPTGGLAYLASPPTNLSDILSDPLHALCYLAFILSACALFSKTWIEISGQSVNDVAKQLKDGGMMIPGNHRDTSVKKILKRYIPIAAVFGGMCIGALTVVADFMGAIGSVRSVTAARNRRSRPCAAQRDRESPPVMRTAMRAIARSHDFVHGARICRAPVSCWP